MSYQHDRFMLGIDDVANRIYVSLESHSGCWGLIPAMTGQVWSDDRVAFLFQRRHDFVPTPRPMTSAVNQHEGTHVIAPCSSAPPEFCLMTLRHVYRTARPDNGSNTRCLQRRCRPRTL